MITRALLLVAILFSAPSFAQTPVPIEYCLPGIYGKQWPGSQFDAGTRTDNGWYAFVFCDAGGGRLYPRARVCAHGECLSQTVNGSAVGRLLIESVGKDRSPVFEAAPEGKRAYRCGAWQVPALGIAPYEPPPAVPPLVDPPIVEPGTARARICADAFAAMKAVWPLTGVVIIPPPPPPPIGIWTAYGGTIFKVVAGKLASVVSGKTALKGVQCTGVTLATAGTFVYQALVGGPVDEATRCIKQ